MTAPGIRTTVFLKGCPLEMPMVPQPRGYFKRAGTGHNWVQVHRLRYVHSSLSKRRCRPLGAGCGFRKPRGDANSRFRSWPRCHSEQARRRNRPWKVHRMRQMCRFVPYPGPERLSVCALLPIGLWSRCSKTECSTSSQEGELLFRAGNR